MARKDSHKRICIPIDFWNNAEFSNYTGQKFAFFLTDETKVCIAPLSIGTELNYEFLGYCKFDSKHRFVFPNNVEICLKEGDTYFFSSSINKSIIYINKPIESDYLIIKKILEGIRGSFEESDK